ncbi:uncharacterized protein LOC112568747 isoform X2 [Pomacea canaliculata]|uniref:uncharacterized protein LOC112568747 isoform X2 n=1 Tax=Pomacea canaliculata TaxID=400727 RepID=UPI000D726940|nr:uncharacterized protein LOC112568747 isoform X2 [Pomacea canaliculata]
MDSSSPKGSKAANFYSGRDVRRDEILLTVIILSPLQQWYEGEPITCDFPSVAPMEEARLTCYFPEDVHRAQKDIVVYRHVLDGSPEAVLGCWWRNAHLDCSTRQGYVFDDVISDHLTIRVPHATADKTGTYACQVTGYRADEAKICEFILNNDVPDHSSYKGLPIQNNYPILHVVDGTVIGLLVFLLLLIALAMCYLRHRVRIKEVWGRFTKVFKDKELDPLVKHENEAEGSKREPEVPEVVVVCGRRGHAMCGWEGPALSRPDSIVETIETEQDESENNESCANHTEPRLEEKSRDTSGAGKRNG